MNRKYYYYKGYLDSSGCPEGVVIKAYTDYEYERYSKIYILIPVKGENQ